MARRASLATVVAILCEDTVVYQTDFESQTGISSIVDWLVAEPEKFNNCGADGD
jgi:hypothetical protein